MFDFRNHVCLVSELFGMSVFDFLKENKFQPFPERHIQDFAKSLLKSLSCECREEERMAVWGGPAC
jgi:dual-specificity kinase